MNEKNLHENLYGLVRHANAGLMRGPESGMTPDASVANWKQLWVGAAFKVTQFQANWMQRGQKDPVRAPLARPDSEWKFYLKRYKLWL